MDQRDLSSPMESRRKYPLSLALLVVLSVLTAFSQANPDATNSQLFSQGYLTPYAQQHLPEELLFQNAVQTYLWALPALNMYGMKEASEKTFGKGYNVLPIFKQRLNAKTVITTPNSDVIYAMGYVDLKEDGPLVIEVPPGLQGILDDFWQRGICSDGEIEGRVWCGDIGLPGPDHGKGGKYLLLPPEYKGTPPPGYFTMRSRTYGVFVFWRGFFQDPKNLAPAVKIMEQTRIYPLGKRDTANPMKFPDASNVPVNMLFPTDGTAFDMLARFIEHEYVDPEQMWMRGMAANLGIVKGKPFAPDASTRATLDRAARVAFGMSRAVAFTPSGWTKWFPDRKWLNVFVGDNPNFTAPTHDLFDPRTSFFSVAYSTSPGMAVKMVGVGAKYLAGFKDSEDKFLSGSSSYHLHLPKGIPAKLFWSVTVYDALTASGLDNGQPFPSINSMDKPITNQDSSTDFYFGPTSPGDGKNWLRTIPGKGFFVVVRLYGPTEPFFNQTWRPGDLEEVR